MAVVLFPFVYLFVFLMAWFQCWMAAFERCKLLILQSFLSGESVLFILPGMCYFNFCLYLLYQSVKQSQETRPGQGETRRFCLD